MKKGGLFSDKIDTTLFICVILLAISGIVTVHSAAASLSGHHRYVAVQASAYAIGLFAMICIIFFRYTYLKNLRHFIFFAGVGLLCAVLAFGKLTNGTQGWFEIGPISLQPSEIAKLCFIITLSAHLSAVKEKISRAKTLFLLFLHLLCYLAPVLLQPDFGTASVFLVIFVTEVFFAGVPVLYMFASGGILAAISPVIWHFLAPFQRQRIKTFFKPENDPLGSGYHIIQSKIAIGSGQIIGRGYMKGPQTQFGYLPEKQTDFAFSVIGEEFGFIGTIFITALLFITVYRCFDNARANTHDPFGELLCVGVGAMLMFHTVENIGMCIGIMPITGIPLPFISYGGSSVVTCFSAVGLVQSVAMRRRSVKFNI